MKRSVEVLKKEIEGTKQFSMKNIMVCYLVIFSVKNTYGQQWKTYTNNSNPFIYCMMTDNEGKLWAGTEQAGLLIYDPVTDEFTTGNAPWFWVVWSIVSDKNNNVWLGVQFEGLYKWNGTNWKHYSNKLGNAPKEIENPESIITDVDGNIWVKAKMDTVSYDLEGLQSESHGLGDVIIKFDGTTWKTYNYFNNVTKYFYEMASDKTGNVWTVAFDTIAKFDGANWTIIQAPAGISTYFIATSNNNIWIAGENGIGQFDGITWTLYTQETTCGGLPSDTIYNITIDKNDVKWFGTNKGLVKFDGLNWITYNHSNSQLPANKISHISIDKYNNIWLESVDVESVKNNRIIYFTKISGLIDNSNDALKPRNIRE